MRLAIAILLSLLSTIHCKWAYGQLQQSDDSTNVSLGIEIILAPGIMGLADKNKIMAEKKEGKMPGYRIQIHFNSDRNKSKEIRTQFLGKYPDIPAYEKYEQPNFKIRVGNFRTRIDAYSFYKQIAPEFPGAFIVQDEIEILKIE